MSDISKKTVWSIAVSIVLSGQVYLAQNTRATVTYNRIKTRLNAVPAIDTHDHLWPFDKLPGY